MLVLIRITFQITYPMIIGKRITESIVLVLATIQIELIPVFQDFPEFLKKRRNGKTLKRPIISSLEREGYKIIALNCFQREIVEVSK